MAGEQSLQLVNFFDRLNIAGIAAYILELLSAVKDLDVAYVSISLGSGIRGMLAGCDALNLKTKIVGVVSAHASANVESFSSACPVEFPVSTKIADGIGCCIPEFSAMALWWKGVERNVQVCNTEILESIRIMYECAYNVCYGASAAKIPVAIKVSSKNKGLKVTVIAPG